MSRRATIIAVVLCCLGGCGPGTRVVRTANESQAILKQFFLGQLAGIDYAHGELGLRWRPDNAFGRPAGRREAVRVGTEYTTVDHHANQRFTVVVRDGGSFEIDYLSSFDHRSFGRDLITVDRGRFTVRWQDANR